MEQGDNTAPCHPYTLLIYINNKAIITQKEGTGKTDALSFYSVDKDFSNPISHQIRILNPILR